MKYAKLQVAAQEWGVHYRTILSWANTNKIQYIILPSGARQYELPSHAVMEGKTIGYIRVSSYSQKENLNTQRQLLLSQYPNAEIISEVASGLNFKRKKLWDIMESSFRGDVSTLVVTHKDRLSRFGFDFIQRVLGRFNCKLVVLHHLSTSPEQELVQDILSIIHVFSSRLYGLRKYSDELKGIQNGSRQRPEKVDKVLDEGE